MIRALLSTQRPGRYPAFPVPILCRLDHFSASREHSHLRLNPITVAVVLKEAPQLGHSHRAAGEGGGNLLAFHISHSPAENMVDAALAVVPECACCLKVVLANCTRRVEECV